MDRTQMRKFANIARAAVAKYEWHLIHKISMATGITVGGEDAV